MTSYHICSIPGDGVGQEVVPQALRVLDAVAAANVFGVSIEEQSWGSAYYAATGRMMPEDGHEIVARADATIFGAVGSPDVPDTISAWGLILSTRQKLDLYLNLRPIRSLPSPLGKGTDFDFLIVRENTEGEYMDVGGRPFKGRSSEMAVQTVIFTAAGIERAIEGAFGRVPAGGLLTSVTKSNALPRTMGLWDDVAQAVADRHPYVRWESMHVDAVAFQMVRDPGRFDVLVASNLFGDILSDLGAGLQGSLGFAASGNVNPEHGTGVFEPIHGSAPDIAGQGTANPCGAINSVAMLLDFLGEERAATEVTEAVDRTLADGVATPDVGGAASTVEFTDEVLSRLSPAGAIDDGSQIREETS